MDVIATGFSGLVELRVRGLEDRRGLFRESYNKRRLASVGIDTDFVQDNVSLSKSVGTLRGLHFQRPPTAQAKLVGVLKGSARDIVVDLRRSSKTFGLYFSILLSEVQGNQLFVPAGFAHGFVTLEPNTLFAYKVSSYYSPEHESGIRFDDPILGIEWGRAANDLVVSERAPGPPWL